MIDYIGNICRRLFVRQNRWAKLFRRLPAGEENRPVDEYLSDAGAIQRFRQSLRGAERLRLELLAFQENPQFAELAERFNRLIDRAQQEQRNFADELRFLVSSARNVELHHFAETNQVRKVMKELLKAEKQGDAVAAGINVNSEGKVEWHFYTDILQQDASVPQTPEDPDLARNTVAAMAVESWRMRGAYNRLADQLDERAKNRFLRQISAYFEKLKDSMESTGLRLVNIEGQRFDPGMAVKSLNMGDFDEGDELIVEQMIEPIVMHDDNIHRMGTVILRKEQHEAVLYRN